MVTTVEVDWGAAGGQNSGAGSDGSPWGSVHYALQQQFAAQPSLTTLAGLVVNVRDSTGAGMPANDATLTLSSYGFTGAVAGTSIEIRAHSSKRPTGLGPQLTLLPTAASVAYFIDIPGLIIDGFLVHHANTVSTNAILFSTSTGGTSCTIRNCKMTSVNRAWGTSARYINYHTGFLIENCLLVGGREWLNNAGGASTGTGRNCSFVDQNVGDVGINIGSSFALYSSIMRGLGVGGTAVESGTTGAGNAIDGSTQGQAGIWTLNGTLVSGDFVDAAGGDYRLSAASACIGQGDGSHFSATDMFGNARVTPDIGFHQYTASAGGILLRRSGGGMFDSNGNMRG